jgi:hypothetical protein
VLTHDLVMTGNFKLIKMAQVVSGLLIDTLLINEQKVRNAY